MRHGSPPNKGRRFPPEVLTSAEVCRLLDACSRRAPTGIRNRALIATLYRSGLRIGEALALRPKDVELHAGTIRVLRGKGNRDRTVGLDQGAAALLDLWLARRTSLGITGHSPVFCTLRGQSLSPNYVRDALKRLALRAGVEKRVHPHGLRHTCAAELAAEGVPMNAIQAQLGHANLSTTSRYLAHIAPAELIR